MEIHTLREVHQQSDFDACTTLTKYQGYLEKIRLDYEDLWQDVIDYLAFNRYNFLQNREKGQKANTLVYDGSPISAWGVLVDGLEGNLISQSGKWLGLTLPNIVQFPRTSPMRKYNGRLDEIPDVKVWLEWKEDVLYGAFKRSNFYSETNTMIRDASSIGTASMFAEEEIGRSRINFQVNNPGEIWIAENRYGEVDTVFRKFKLAAQIAAQKWDTANMSAALRSAVDNAPWSEFEFIHACFPRNDIEMYLSEDGTFKPKRGEMNLPWASIYIQVGHKEKVLKRSGFRFNPFICWRWWKNSEEWYGRSPGMDAIVDIMKLNSMEKSLTYAGQLAVEPPMLVHEKFRGKLRMSPRGRNYTKNFEEERIMPINQGINFPIGQASHDKVRAIIEDHFKTKFFLMLYEAAMSGRQLSVPQVMEMQGEKASLMSSIIGRIISEFLNPVVSVVDDIETQAGRMPDPPQMLTDLFAGTQIEIEYLGTLAMAQKRMVKTQGIYQAISAIEPLMKVNPEIVDYIDADETAKEILRVNGWPAKAIKTDDEVKAIREARKKQMEKKEQMEQMEKMAQYLPNVQKATETGSPLHQISKALGVGGEEEGAAA
jgi:Bacteriophage head to tail connecting protein